MTNNHNELDFLKLSISDIRRFKIRTGSRLLRTESREEEKTSGRPDKQISVQKAASLIITEQPQSIQSVEESKEKINPADSGSVEIQDINPEIDEGHVEEERPEEP